MSVNIENPKDLCRNFAEERKTALANPETWYLVAKSGREPYTPPAFARQGEFIIEFRKAVNPYGTTEYRTYVKAAQKVTPAVVVNVPDEEF